METSELLQLVIAGLKNGSIYALLALGFTIVFAATNVINFAQGEFYMLGGMFGVMGFSRFGLPLWLAVPLAVLLVACIGMAFEFLAIRPRKDADPMALVIITVGGSLVFASLARHLFGSDALALPDFTPGPSIALGGAAVERQTLWIWGLVVVAVVGLSLLYGKTRLGRAMRACMQNREAARLMGIDTARVVMISFGLAAALGALVGVAVTPLTSVRFDIGAGIGVKGFAAAILGGLGSPLAAVVGGLLLGLIEQAVIPFSSAMKDVIALAVLLTVLFVRPQGLFRRTRKEKV
ncbi:MAG: branched-chain amino acid ABC transporter permease [Coriobacteriia bacterium]|nr:branched-chain amino acid ABC transporter permease [Coriobacteriia bacterium]